jgi:hypothetical protein
MVWRRRQRLDARVPEQFTEVLDAVIAFADPVLTDPVTDTWWSAEHRQWLSPAALAP